MKRIYAIIILILALAPYLTIISAFEILSRSQFESSFLGNKSNGYFGPFEWILLIEWAAGLLVFSLHIQGNQSLDKQNKDSWRIKIWFFQIIAIMMYWYKFIWRRNE